MKKIVIDARKIKSSTGRVVYELVRHLEKIDHTNSYTVLVMPDELDYYKPQQSNFKVMAADFKPYSFAEQIGFNRFLRQLEPDLVHFHMPQQPLLYTRPAVTTVHDLNLVRVKENDMNPIELFIKKKLFAFLLRRVAHRAAHIITPTQYTKDDLVQWARINPSNVTVTHLGLFRVTKTEPVPNYQDVPYFIYLGRAEPYKNNRRMIQAHQQLLQKNSRLRMVICGAIDELRQADIEWVKENGYKNVDFLGWLSDEKAAWLYQHAVAYVGPSYMEGFGLPALEAMAQGAPVLSADTTCSPEVLGSGAHYFNPFNTNDMARAMQDILTDSNLRKKLKVQGAQQVKKYSWQRMSEQVYNIYNRLLA